jgi:hypothetical protein
VEPIELPRSCVLDRALELPLEAREVGLTGILELFVRVANGVQEVR